MTKQRDTPSAGADKGASPGAGARHSAVHRGAGKRATIYDLARIAKVSPGTVSRVLNNRDRVKTETREAVLRAAAELNLKKPQASVRNREVAILSEPTYPDRFELCGNAHRPSFIRLLQAEHRRAPAPESAGGASHKVHRRDRHRHRGQGASRSWSSNWRSACPSFTSTSS